MPDRPDVSVDTITDTGKTYVVVSRTTVDGSPRGRSYEVDGSTANEKIKSAVEKVLADPYAAEWLPK